jgi:hypothetical protein
MPGRERVKWYDTARWKHRRHDQLSREPFCRFCLAKDGVHTMATVADHIEPHQGDAGKFWNGPLQSLCKRHHDSDKQLAERMDRPLAVDADGWPRGV